MIFGVEKVVKPDSNIYEILFERYGLVPSESLFIDDNAPNIEVAKSLGLNTILFKNPEQLKEELSKFEIL